MIHLVSKFSVDRQQNESRSRMVAVISALFKSHSSPQSTASSIVVKNSLASSLVSLSTSSPILLSTHVNENTTTSSSP